MDKLKIIGLAAIIFAVSLPAYYYPIHKKGYSIDGGLLNLSAAKNYVLAGTYKYQSGNGAFLSPGRAVAEGKETGMSNPLTAIIYSRLLKLFNISDLLKFSELLTISLFALFNSLVFLLIRRLFGTTVGLTSSLSMAFMPVMAVGALSFGMFEFAMLFFAAALFFYFDPKKLFHSSGIFRLMIASGFFALAALSRNAFMVSFAPFVLFDYYKNRNFKRTAVFLAPFLIIFGLTLTPYSWLGVPNGYTSRFDEQPINQIGEVFPDPYSAYYSRDDYISGLEGRSFSRSEAHFLDRWGYDVPVKEHIKAYFDSFKYYISEAVNLTNFGGPLIVLIMIAGAYYLYRHERDMFLLFSFWLVIWLGALVYWETANWDHFLEIIIIAAILTGLGLKQFAGFIKNINLNYKFLTALILIFTLGHLTFASKWRLFDSYRSSNFGEGIKAAEAVEKANPAGVIAVGGHVTTAYTLYFLTSRDVIYFSPDTVGELISNGKLEQAFNIYGVKSFIGYDSEKSSAIVDSLGIELIPFTGKADI